MFETSQNLDEVALVSTKKKILKSYVCAIFQTIEVATNPFVFKDSAEDTFAVHR